MTMTKQPNILFILADDLGMWALGAAGNHEVLTPNMDKLAEDGVWCDNFYCTSPVCSPARASILSGKIPSQHGVHDWIRSGNMNKEKLEPAFKDHPLFKEEHKAIDYLEGQTTYPQLLAEAGYVCALSGKWHLGNSLKPHQGFTHWYTIARGGCHYMQPDIVENGNVDFKEEYVTNLITENAIHCINEFSQGDRPFYLSVHYTAPHSPWDRSDHPEKYISMYDNCLFHSVPELPIHPNQIPTAPYGEGERRKELLRGYYASITAMDDGIGQLMAELEEKDMRKNTLIIVMSDNGMNMGHHGVWGKGNGTFPLNMFDTSIKVPAIFSYPGVIPSGTICEELISQYDIFPTLLEYAGIHYPNEERLPGKSFAGLLRGEADCFRDDVVIFDEYGPVRMIRTKEWKYVHRYPYGPHELYHLKDDPDEEINKIDDTDCEVIVDNLRNRLGEWFSTYVEPNKDGIYAPVTGYGQVNLAVPGLREGSSFAYKVDKE
ncbi:arylsulfatase A-like enzyme [Paenibacillus shirakamiensis]|uniref:Arylsulfatase A-like enzyme n=1 Tax=Paenibacillus shirakamiensis TaxID=1265935 RepID=A0ABS4JHQ3_9BACL|nr:sulfatase-like hydrolase/transferase [Paenibacillus shirakamiensis]MBP2000069.1 arylsulfatase A-like enzyme [Paenibacillus shirakamiensis]